jgi:TolB-like protein
LDSWKEIAAYLGRSEKTARRWEDREQLPVHRLLHEKRGSVYAYTGELDRWWAARKLTVNSGCAPNEGEPQDLDLAEQSAEGNGIASPGSTTVSPSGLSAEITDSPAPATTDEHQRIGSSWLTSRSLPVTLAGLAASLVSIVLTPFAWHWVTAQRAVETGGPIRSLAVLPLKNLSEQAGQQYFADGMTDELITELAKISALRVISRTSVMQYRDEKKSLPEIARQLKVDAVVEGTLLRAGDTVKITAQLIRPAPETHLWTKSYERNLRNVSDLEREVARAIAGEIKIELTQRERAGLSTAGPVDSAAHENYLRGIYFWNKRTEQDLQKSIQYFERAIQRDPSYALAYAGLANAYNSLGAYAHFRPPRNLPESACRGVESPRRRRQAA